MILHIGTHKSGSTSLQNVLYKNSKTLLDYDVDYPQNLCIWDSAHHPLGWCMKNDYQNIDREFNYDKSKGVIHHYLSQIKKSKAQTIVISTETLFVATDYKKLKSFYDLLTQEYDVSVIMYLRHQSNFLFSWYSELVTAWYGKITIPFANFLENPMYPVEYDKVIDRWVEIFGSESVRVFSFESVASSSEGLVGHFFNNFLPEVSFEKLDMQGEFSRVSFSPEDIEKIREINKLDLSEDSRQVAIRNLEKSNSREKSKEVIKVQEIISKKYQESNNRLLRKYGVDVIGFYNKLNYE